MMQWKHSKSRVFLSFLKKKQKKEKLVQLRKTLVFINLY